jgi:hypothetical protein
MFLVEVAARLRDPRPRRSCGHAERINTSFVD